MICGSRDNAKPLRLFPRVPYKNGQAETYCETRMRRNLRPTETLVRPY